MEGTVNHYQLGQTILTTPFLPPYLLSRFVLLGALLGFILTPYFTINWFSWTILLVIWLVSLLNKKFNRKYSWLILGLLLAFGRGLAVKPINSLIITSGPSEFAATVVRPPKLKDRTTTYFLKNNQNITIIVTTRPYPEYYYGDRLWVKCSSLSVLESSYKNQPARWACPWPVLNLIARPTDGWRLKIASWRTGLSKRLTGWLAEPYASLASGMLWGDDSALPKTITESFKKTGTTHLLAVSGYNVMVLTSILFWILISLGWRVFGASWLVAGAVVVFVIFTGAEAATVRAGLMALMVMLAYCLKQKVNKFNLLLLAACLMLFYQPLYLFDLGWQLSFAAMVGLLWLAPLLRRRLIFITNKFGLQAAAVDTLSASLITLPLILWQLKQLSVVSPLANLLIGPLVVLVFIFGLPILIIPPALEFLIVIFVWSLQFILSYMVKVVTLLASWPSSWLESSGLVWLMVLIVYFLLFRILFYQPKK